MKMHTAPGFAREMQKYARRFGHTEWLGMDATYVKVATRRTTRRKAKQTLGLEILLP